MTMRSCLLALCILPLAVDEAMASARLRFLQASPAAPADGLVENRDNPFFAIASKDIPRADRPVPAPWLPLWP